ncbi:MAG TPA: methyltransferase domain-containing protein [Polyangia bacterium]|nr:methyltransferase domain-containing protein [Polyangia bacterium]
MPGPWWHDFFDEEYVRLFAVFTPPERSQREADALWSLLGLSAGSRLLDAPCGYGRLSVPLAERGARVVGVDYSEALLRQAESARGPLPPDRLRFLRHDLRQPLSESGFDAAINVFSSLGYGSEEDDLAILRTLAAAVRPGGLVLVETNHRDVAVSMLAHGNRLAQRLDDGTLLIEEPRFDAVAGRIETSWYWSGPRGSGQKAGSLRVYSITELVRLMEAAGLRLRSAHSGLSAQPYVAQPPLMGGRVGLLAERA